MEPDCLDGVFPVLPTPFGLDLEVDEGGLRSLVAFCVEWKFPGVVVLGSNGEFPYLTFDEKVRVMSVAAEAAAGRLAVVGTASSGGTAEAVALARAAKSVGCDAVMAAVPLYFQI